MNVQFPRILRPFFGKTIWRKNSSEKVIYLTFDDGPNPGVTPQVLDILDRFEVKATFFCVGENVSRFPDVFDEVKRRGHTVGNHTFNHLKGFEYSTDDYVRNVKKASEFIDSRLFRPPHGQIKPSQIKALKDDYLIIMWDFITYDYDKRIEPEKIIAEVKKRCRIGSFVVFHDTLKAEKNVLQVLPEALRFWKENGYEVCHI